jgi:hypothetical protein
MPSSAALIELATKGGTGQLNASPTILKITAEQTATNRLISGQRKIGQDF